MRRNMQESVVFHTDNSTRKMWRRGGSAVQGGCHNTHNLLHLILRFQGKSSVMAGRHEDTIILSWTGTSADSTILSYLTKHSKCARNANKMSMKQRTSCSTATFEECKSFRGYLKTTAQATAKHCAPISRNNLRFHLNWNKIENINI